MIGTLSPGSLHNPNPTIQLHSNQNETRNLEHRTRHEKLLRSSMRGIPANAQRPTPPLAGPWVRLQPLSYG